MERDPYIGRMIGGRYQLESLLGRGGFGAVYRARHVALDRIVAVKLNLHLHKRELTERFKREAKAMARLRHPRCVTLLDYGDEDGLTYMVQEYVDGATVARAIAGQARMAPSRAVAIVDGVLDALGAAHRVGIVHRDIKPGNVMLVREDEQEDVRVLDFGIAKVFEADDDPTQLTASGRAIGTPSYMSPEQIRGREVGPATDIYSSGVLLFHLLTGQRPFRGESIFDVYRAHLEDEPPTAGMGVPDALGDVIRRAMAKDPEARYATTAEMRDAMQAALAVADATVLGGTPVLDTVESGPPASLAGLTDSAIVAASVEATSPPARAARWPWAVGMVGVAAVLAWTWVGRAPADGMGLSQSVARDAGRPSADAVLDGGRPVSPVSDAGGHDGMSRDGMAADGMAADGSPDAAPDARVDAVVDAAVDAAPKPAPKRRARPAWRREVDAARDALRRHRYTEAEERLKRAQAAAPKSVVPSLELGKLYLHQKRYPQAIAALQRARALDAKHEEVLFRLAQATLHGGGDDRFFYLYRRAFPKGRFAGEVDAVIGPRAGAESGPLDIK